MYFSRFSNMVGQSSMDDLVKSVSPTLKSRFFINIEFQISSLRQALDFSFCANLKAFLLNYLREINWKKIIFGLVRLSWNINYFQPERSLKIVCRVQNCKGINSYKLKDSPTFFNVILTILPCRKKLSSHCFFLTCFLTEKFHFFNNDEKIQNNTIVFEYFSHQKFTFKRHEYHIQNQYKKNGVE